MMECHLCGHHKTHKHGKTSKGTQRYYCPVGRQIFTETFKSLWQALAFCQCYFWVSDGNPVYPNFIPHGDQIVSKTYMNRVEGENTRLRHYLARLHQKTLCYSKSIEMFKHSVRLLIHYLKFWDVPVPA